MVEAARLGQLSTVRQLLNGGTATVEDQDEVKCVCACSNDCLHVCYQNIGLSLSSLHADVTIAMSAMGSQWHSVANREFGGV